MCLGSTAVSRKRLLYHYPDGEGEVYKGSGDCSSRLFIDTMPRQ